MRDGRPIAIGKFSTEGFWSGKKVIKPTDTDGIELLRFTLPFPMLVTLECSALPDTGLFVAEYGDERFTATVSLLPNGFLADDVKAQPISIDRWVIVCRTLRVIGFHPGVAVATPVTVRANAALGPVSWSGVPVQASRSVAGEATTVPVAQSAVAVDILAALAAERTRLGMAVYNDAGAALLLRADGGVASALQFTVRIPPGGYWEMPQPGFSGRISGIWAGAGAGNALVTQYHVQRF